jgi:excisionase family DNA binding protein
MIVSDGQYEYMTSGSAAEFLGISKKTLYRWDEKGKLVAYKPWGNGYRFYKVEDLKKFKESLAEKEWGV